MSRFFVHHVTKYTYAEPVRDSANQIMLYPIKDQNQEVQSQRLTITGEPFVETFRDYYGNEVGSFMSLAPHTELRIDSNLVVITKPILLPADDAPVDEQWDYLRKIQYVVPFIDFLKQEYFEALPEVKQIADGGFYQTVTVFTAVKQLNEYVYQNFEYIQGITNVETTLDQVWRLRAGVCQDFAHMLLVMLRLLQIPSRYVSGYVCAVDNKLRGDGATHAWVEAYIPFYGWLGLDPTNNSVVNDDHVRLAIGRNFNDCSPVKGTYKGTAKQVLEVGVTVSLEEFATEKETLAIVKPLEAKDPLNEGAGDDNSYRRYVQMKQQQQQQQQ